MFKFHTLLLFSCFLSSNWQTYTDNVNNFKINFPKEWSKELINGNLTFLSRKENNQDLFQENVNIIIQDLSKQPMNLEQYTELTKKQVIDNVGASAIISMKSTKLSGQQAKEFIYSMNYQGKNLKLKQYWFIRKNKAYLLTYTSMLFKYSKYEELATQTILSFKFF